MILSAMSCVLLGVTILSVVTGIVQFFGYSRFQRLMCLPIIKKRFPLIVQTEAIILMAMLFIFVPASYLNKIWNQSDGRHDDIHNGAQNILSVIVNPALLYLLSHIEAMRLWLMYYELMLLQSMQNEGWGKNITSNFWKHDFYLRHRSTRGNVRWLSKWLFVYWFTLSTVSAIMAYYRLINDVGLIVVVCSYFLQMALLLWPLIAIAYLWKNMPAQIGDHMMIEEEFNMTCYVLALSVLGYVVVAVLMALGQTLAVRAALGIAWIFTSAAPSLVATVWIPGRLTQRMVVADASSFNPEIVIFKNQRIAANGSRVVSVLDELAIIYNDEQKMKALGGWMMKRFSTESFLCFVEMVQFKERVIALVKEQNPKFSDANVVRHRHCLYNHCPKSSIVFNLSVLQREPKHIEETVRSESGWVRSEQVDSGRPFWIHTESNEVRFTEPLSEEKAVIPVMNGTDQGMNCGDIGTDRIIFELEEDIICALRRSAHLIFEKYVDNRAALAINISYGMRDFHCRLHQYHFASLSTMQWISLYDDILAVMQDYIVQSYMAMIRRLRDAEIE